MVDLEPSRQEQLPQSQSWYCAILCNPVKYTFLGLAFALFLVIVWCASFILYPIQLALGIRIYRNSKYELKTWPKIFILALLVLSLLEISLLSAELLEAYREGSVEILHLRLSSGGSILRTCCVSVFYLPKS